MKANAYTAHADSLGVAVPPGARFKVVEVTGQGWRGAIWFPATGLTCGMYIGVPVPPGWNEGEPRCGW